MLKASIQLLKKEFTLEFRKKETLFGVLLYIVSTVYLNYLVFNQIIDDTTWNALFWVILLFASVQAASRSFHSESNRQFLYYYQLCSPKSIILSKVVYNMILLGALGLFNFFVYTLFLGNPLENSATFILVTILGASGFAAVLTMVSAIASRTSNNMALMAILSFPLLMPLLITLVKTSTFALVGSDWTDIVPYISLLGLLNLLVLSLSLLLFPYIWQD
ncbi:MAG: heme exporter protein B [Flavobacteriales bacterium]|jgi:heme exporter protein B